MSKYQAIVLRKQKSKTEESMRRSTETFMKKVLKLSCCNNAIYYSIEKDLRGYHAHITFNNIQSTVIRSVAEAVLGSAVWDEHFPADSSVDKVFVLLNSLGEVRLHSVRAPDFNTLLSYTAKQNLQEYLPLHLLKRNRSFY